MSGFRIDGIWAWVAVDPDDGDEGVIGMYAGDDLGWLPLIAADRVRLDEMRPIAAAHALATRRPVTLVRFDVRTELEVIEP